MVLRIHVSFQNSTARKKILFARMQQFGQLAPFAGHA
jgi:hypothetical protein